MFPQQLGPLFPPSSPLIRQHAFIALSVFGCEHLARLPPRYCDGVPALHVNDFPRYLALQLLPVHNALLHSPHEGGHRTTVGAMLSRLRHLHTHEGPVPPAHATRTATASNTTIFWRRLHKVETVHHGEVRNVRYVQHTGPKAVPIQLCSLLACSRPETNDPVVLGIAVSSIHPSQHAAPRRAACSGEVLHFADELVHNAPIHEGAHPNLLQHRCAVNTGHPQHLQQERCPGKVASHAADQFPCNYSRSGVITAALVAVNRTPHEPDDLVRRPVFNPLFASKKNLHVSLHIDFCDTLQRLLNFLAPIV
ncbi:hypothetical protein, conserved in T. vivax, (fragment), partial [Trypanosoma vivax Y486]